MDMLANPPHDISVVGRQFTVVAAVVVVVELAGTSDAHITWENAKMHHRLDTIKMLVFVKLF